MTLDAMKIKLKYQLAEHGLFYRFDLIRRLPEITRWIYEGCTGVAPPPIKRFIISHYLRRYRLKTFIETGTYLGDTLAHIAQNKSINCISIELSNELYYGACERFRYYSNTRVIQGDSGFVLPELLETLTAPALFWLDGHFSGGPTARGGKDSPVNSELQAILESPIKEHVILIDDARCFNGTNDYPYIDDLLQNVRRHGYYAMEVSADIIRLTPERT